jgi:hypothetical protein
MSLQKKPKNKLSLSRLLENENSSVPNTLTEKEVFIVTYLQDEVDMSTRYAAQRAWEKMEPQRMINTVNDIFTPILSYINEKNLKNDLRLYQYIFCSLENNDAVTTETSIRRMKNFNYRIWEARRVVEFVDWRAEIPGFTLEEVKEKSQLIQDRLWDWEPDSHDSDYGDSDFIRFQDEEIDDSYWNEFLVIN